MRRRKFLTNDLGDMLQQGSQLPVVFKLLQTRVCVQIAFAIRAEDLRLGQVPKLPLRESRRRSVQVDVLDLCSGSKRTQSIM